jgi:stress response protein SCP2/tetratricopeptide (TPR) repeat protein
VHQLQRGQRSRLDAITTERALAVDVAAWDLDGDPPSFIALLLDGSGRAVADGVVGAHRPSAVGGAVLWQADGTGRGWISVSLDHLPAEVDRVAFVVGTDTTPLSGLRHGQVRVSGAGQPVVAFDVRGHELETERAITAIELYRKDGWRITAVGQGYAAGLTALLSAHGAALGPAPVAPVTPAAAAPEAPTPVVEDAPADAEEDSRFGDMELIEFLAALDVGTQAQAAGDLDHALTVYETMAGRGAVDGMLLAGAVAAELGDVDRARRWWAVAVENGSGDAAYNLGLLEMEAGDRAAARRLLTEATDLGYPKGHAVLARMAVEAGDPAAAKAHAQQGMALEDPSSFIEYGDLLMLEDPSSPDRYEPHWRRAAELGDPQGMINMAVLCKHHGRPDEAIAWLGRAKEAGDPRADEMLIAYGPPAGRDDPRLRRILAEWPEHALDRGADRATWEAGLRTYELDGYGPMMRCVEQLAPALAHSLYGSGILEGGELPDTIHKLLFASLFTPPDGVTFADEAQRAARLALTFVRERGWQPVEMGGEGLFDHLILDRGCYMLLSTAVAEPGALTGNLREFLTP